MDPVALPGTGDKVFWDYVFQLRQQSGLCDIQLCVKDDEGNFIAFPAHKLVLVASSQYFQDCVSRDELLDVYNFDGIRPQNLQVVLDFMYRQITWTELNTNAEAAVAADILKVLHHDHPVERQSSGGVIEDSEGKKIMFVKVFDKEPSRKHFGPKPDPSPRAGRPANRYVIHSQEDLQRHWRAAKKKHRDEKAANDDELEPEEVIEALPQAVPTAAPVTVLAPATVSDANTTPDVSQLALLADASMVLNRESLTSESQATEIILQEQSSVEDATGHMEDTELVVPESESDGNAGKPGQTEDGQVYYEVETEPGEITYDQVGEDGEIVYKPDDLGPVEVQEAGQSFSIPEAPTDNDKVGVRTRRSSAMAETTTTTTPQTTTEPGVRTRSRGPSAAKAPQNKATPTASPGLPTTPGDIATPVAHASPYGTRKKRIILPESLVRTNQKRVKHVIGQQTASPLVGRQLHTLLVSDSAGDQGVTIESPSQMEATNETHVELIVKGEPEEDQEMEEDDDQGSDADYPLPRRGRRKRVGRLKTRGKKTPFKEPSGQFECTKCNKTFKNITGLRNHDNWKHGTTGSEKATHAGSGDHTCDICQKVVRSYAALSSHKLKVHNIQLRLACNICGETFMQRRLLKAHQHKEHGVDAYTCDVCGNTFRSREGWKIHMYKQHSTDEPSEMCQVCGKVFKMRHELRNHLKITHSNDREHRCHLCERAFKLSSTLKRHIQTYHSNMRNFECDVCKSKFKTKSDLVKHRGLHFREEKPLSASESRQAYSNDNPESNACRFCGKVFEKRYRLKAHEKIVHLEKQEGINYICTICNKSFAVKHYLMAHIAQKHRPRRYKCSRCQYEFSQPYMLRKHIAKCKGYPISAKPFKCPQCGRSFNLKGNLTKHMQLGRCERAKNEIVDYVVVVQQDGNVQSEAALDNTTVENLKAAQDLELQASQALQEMHGAAQMQGMQELQVQTSGEIETETQEISREDEAVILQGGDQQHATVTTAEDGTVILHMLDAGDAEQGHVLHESAEQEVQTTILEIEDQEQLSQALQGTGTQIVQLGIEQQLQQGYTIGDDQQNIIVQIIQEEEDEEEVKTETQ